MTEVQPQKNVVLLGIGHTNAHVVKEWATDPIPGCRLICISKFPTATYSGMLPGTLGLQFDDGEMRIDLQRLADRAGAELVLADACGLDLQAGDLQFHDHDPIRFDTLSIGVGSIPAGWLRHTGSELMVPIKPMQTFLQRLNERLDEVERRSDLKWRVAIVGGGVASIEIAFCLQQQLGKRSPQGYAEITVFTDQDHVAAGMSKRSVRRIEKLLVKRGIVVRSASRVMEVGDADIETESGQRYQADCVIWATGATAPPVLAKLGLETTGGGFIATHKTLQSLSDPRVFAVGDSGTVVESPSPKAGVYAVRQCPVLWHNLRSLVAGGAMKEFDPQSDFLKILNTGDGRALLQYGKLTAHARWCWKLKTWIDKRFVREYQGGKS